MVVIEPDAVDVRELAEAEANEVVQALVLVSGDEGRGGPHP